jgi:hypothetical protein
MEEKERKLKELEKEWTRKVDENDVDEEEDDNAHDIELGETIEPGEANEMLEEDEDDWIDEDEAVLEASLKSVLEIRKGTWNSLMERLEVEAKETES